MQRTNSNQPPSGYDPLLPKSAVPVEVIQAPPGSVRVSRRGLLRLAGLGALTYGASKTRRIPIALEGPAEASAVLPGPTARPLASKRGDQAISYQVEDPSGEPAPDPLEVGFANEAVRTRSMIEIIRDKQERSNMDVSAITRPEHTDTTAELTQLMALSLAERIPGITPQGLSVLLGNTTVECMNKPNAFSSYNNEYAVGPIQYQGNIDGTAKAARLAAMAHRDPPHPYEYLYIEEDDYIKEGDTELYKLSILRRMESQGLIRITRLEDATRDGTSRDEVIADHIDKSVDFLLAEADLHPDFNYAGRRFIAGCTDPNQSISSLMGLSWEHIRWLVPSGGNDIGQQTLRESYARKFMTEVKPVGMATSV